MLIYKATNLLDGKCYIGYTTSSLKERQNDHYKKMTNRNSKTHFHNALRLYGNENFKWEILDDHFFFTYFKEEFEKKTYFSIMILKGLEKYYIDKFDSKNNGYNLTDGGDGTHGYSPTKEHRSKISKTTTGRKKSEETRKKISESKKGIPRSEETRKKLQGENNGFYGKHHTEEAKVKISFASSGKNNPNYGKPMPEEQKENISNTLRNKNIDDNIIIELLKQEKTQKQIAERFGCSQTTISQRLLKLNIDTEYFRYSLLFPKIEKLKKEGLSIQKIANELNCSIYIINNRFKKMKEKGEYVKN